MNTDLLKQAEANQLEICRRLGIRKQFLSVDDALPILTRIFESLLPLDSRIGDLSGLVADQNAMLGR